MQGVARLRPGQGDLRLPQDDPQHVVEIVGHPPGQTPHGFHLLRMEQLLPKLLPLSLRPKPCGDVPGIPQKPGRRKPYLRQRPPARLPRPRRETQLAVGATGLKNLLEGGKSLGKAIRDEEIREAPGKQFLLRVSRHPAGLGVGLEDTPLSVGDEDPVGGVLHVASPQFLPRPKGFLRPLVRRDVPGDPQNPHQIPLQVPHGGLDGLEKPLVAPVPEDQPLLVDPGPPGLRRQPVVFPEERCLVPVQKILVPSPEDLLLPGA